MKLVRLPTASFPTHAGSSWTIHLSINQDDADGGDADADGNDDGDSGGGGGSGA